MAEAARERQARADADPGALASAFELLSAGWRYFRARLELAGMEGREAATVYLKCLALLLGGTVVLVFGYLFLCLCLVFAIASAFGGGPAWIWVTFAAAVLHLAGGSLLLWRIRAMTRRPVFEATVREFRNDETWLNATIAKQN